jgi:hypothetical protein
VSKTDSPCENEVFPKRKHLDGEQNVHHRCTLKQGTPKIQFNSERTDKDEQLQIKFKQNNDIKNETKENRYMGRKTQMPVINSITVSYNGEQEKFDNFIGSLLKSYLDSDSLTNTEQLLSVQKVDLSEKSA